MGSAKSKAHLYSTPPPVTDSTKDQPQVSSAPGMRIQTRQGKAKTPHQKLLFRPVPWSHGFDRAHTSSTTSPSIPLFLPGHLLCLTPDMSSVVRRPWLTKESGRHAIKLQSWICTAMNWLIHEGITTADLPRLYILSPDSSAFASCIKTFYEFKENLMPGFFRESFFLSYPWL